MPQFIGYHIDDSDHSVPVATGHNQQETLFRTITRVLSYGLTYGSLTVQERNDLSTEDFTQVTQIVDQFAVKHGAV